MKTRRRGFTLIEIIISIVILSFVSAVLLKLFMTADKLNTSANDKSVASVMAANAIESFDTDTSPYTIYYDKNWTAVTQSDVWSYKLDFLVIIGDVSTLYTLESSVKNRDEKEVVSYKTSRFVKGGE